MTTTPTDEMRRREAARKGTAATRTRRRPGTLKGQFRDLTQRVRDFDARGAAEDTARATFDVIREDLDEDVERLRGSQVGRGRIDSGFGFEDEDRLVRGAYENLTRVLAMNALNAEGLNLQARGLEGDLVSGGLDREQAAKNAERKRKGGLFGALGAIAGTVIGGPGLGTFLGGKAGEAVGGFI